MEGTLKIDADWDKPAWQKVTAATLENFMGARPEHFPKTQFKVVYDDQNIYVIFRVADRFVKAVGQKHQDPVCKDSCVEFFFTPGADSAQGYFNLEMNCCGVILLHHHPPGGGGGPLADEELDRIEVAHSQPKPVAEEIKEPVTWTVEYRLPLAVVAKHAAVTAPQAGAVPRANFCKCADGTSQPHWLTWSPVGGGQPHFHQPGYFGRLVFE